LPPDVMDTEDALLHESIEKYNSEYNNLPKLPDPDVFARWDARFTSINQLIDVMTDDELRQTLDPIGVVVVSAAGVTIRYTGDAATLIPYPVVLPVSR
jgi:hypothetical protein